MQTILIQLSLLLILSIEISTSNSKSDLLSDEFINEINEKQSLWKAGRNFRKDISMSYIRRLLGRRVDSNHPKPPELRHNLVTIEVPESFDWRDHYPNCSTIRDIRDQGACGSCWAFATVEVISDRICIHSEGKQDVYISANDLLSCCRDCGQGCQGGSAYSAFGYWTSKGIVTGGPYGSNEGCRPYELPPCEHHIDGTRPPCDKMHYETPECKQICQKSHSVSYEKDLYFGRIYYTEPQDVTQIQAEIMLNGPVVAGFTVYTDFFNYKSGVYKYTKGNAVDGHDVKILGWGVENDTEYWLVANSWNTDWGDKGFFKILRGENHCGIEENVVAGIPA